MAKTASVGEVRAWAKSQGYDVRDRGRLPAEVLTAWEAHHQRPAAARDGRGAGVAAHLDELSEKLGATDHRVDDVVTELDATSRRLTELEEQLSALTQRLAALEEHRGAPKRRFARAR